ncbi:AraC family transcriptional regulator [Oscillospiraceae bacterium]|nr:AraC family transcriptional regulator [Oscillospiraceae bacterium]BDF74363.1 AraC family transcriptional regulator [Oscillospiraceae bacterium]
MSNNRYELGAEGGSPVDRSSTKLLYVSTAKYGGDWHSMLHTHACTELFYVVGGGGQFKIADLTLPAAPDDLIIVNPNVEHTEVSLNQSPLEYIVLGVEGLEFRSGEEEDGRYARVSLRSDREEVLFFLRSLLREIENKAAGYEVLCQDLLEVLLVRIMRRTNFSLTVAPPNRRSSKECAAVRRYIDGHFKENITLDMLSELAHVNKYYMVHAFTREYGVSPINYLISRRIQESRYLLSDTDHSLSQISHMLGFSSPSYFSQSFRKLEGRSPMEYRKARRAEREEGGGDGV